MSEMGPQSLEPVSSDVQVAKLHTSCKDCVFRDGLGCRAGRMEKYLAQGAVAECYDDEEEFRVINRACSLFRPRESEWALAHRGRELEAARHEARIRCAFIFLSEEPSSLIAQALASQPTPSEIVVVCRGNASAALKAISDIPHASVVRCMEVGASEARLVDLAVARLSRSGWYAVFRERVPDGFLAELQRLLLDEVERFSVVQPHSDGEGRTAHVGFHRCDFMAGNSPADIDGRCVEWLDEKAVDWARREDKPYLVRQPWGEPR